LTADQINDLCCSCHAKTRPLTESFAPGDRFFDHFSLAALEQPDFYPDGRDLGENFTGTTWRMSGCAQSGKLTCLACHTSSGRWRFSAERANDACLPCHREKVVGAAEHSHHQAGSAGAQCVACHMPTTEFARMRRSDHSMRPPMPAATLAFGSPNACNMCHTNKDAAWADRQVRQWHREDYQAPAIRLASLVAAARRHDWAGLPEIVKYISSPGRDEVRAASLLELLRDCEEDAKWEGIKACLRDASPMVRAAAADALGSRLGPEMVPPLLAATRDDWRLVRIRAAAALAVVPAETVPQEDTHAFYSATAELLASWRARPDDPASACSLGNYYLDRREPVEAIAAFKAAQKLQPALASPLVNIAMACNMAGQNHKAEASLRRALELEPTNAAAHLDLGMLLAEMQRPSEAEQAFRAALKDDPGCAQAAFNLGVLLAAKHPGEALDWCRRAVQLRPREARYAYTLAYFQDQQGNRAEAARTLEELIRRAPHYADAYALLARIYEDQNRISEAEAVRRRAAENCKN
jgi:tetratricopeptide (TPR) repeat protein